MGDYQDPPLRLVIEGLRWLGDDFEATGERGIVTLHGTDSDDDSITVLRALRRALVKRLQMQIPALVVTFGDLDFDAPNFPTEEDIDQLVQTAELITESLRALKQLAPEVVDDDDDDGEDDPEPDPAPTAHSSESGDVS